MSEASTDRADRPAEVTDPLLWGLATAVAGAHQADEDGVCVSPSCVGVTWPCAAWHNAQEALRAAQAPAAGITRPAGTADRTHDDPLTGWSTDLVPTVPGTQPPAAARPPRRDRSAITSAA